MRAELSITTNTAVLEY